MDAEERRALEEELAAELAGLVDEDDGGDIADDEVIQLQHGENKRHQQHESGAFTPVSEYVRLDLDELLRQAAISDQDAKLRQLHQQRLTSDGDALPPQASTPSSWNLLLASVEKCDEDFFAFIQQDLDELQTTILSTPSPISTEVPDFAPATNRIGAASLSSCTASAEDESGDPQYAEEASAAAMAVQSMFRGFAIRRKFANALEMAKMVDGDGGDELEFGEVNLDDLIQMPPELEDGWENPVLPASRRHHHRHEYQQQNVNEPEDENEEGAESGDCEDEQRKRHEDYYQRAPVYGNYSAAPCSNGFGGYSGGGNQSSDIVTHAPNKNEQHPPQQDLAPPAAPAPPATLASTLWDKMRKMKQKQRHAAEERSREQDPMYRLQKIMNKKQSSSKISNNSTSNQAHGSSTSTVPHVPPATISWGSSNGNGEKKKPKVKLPSLVERLRKKTEAAR